jgi:phospho-N-acetylmuramoyl-pentapeptide-transferase
MLYWLADLSTHYDYLRPLNFFRYVTVRTLVALICGFSFPLFGKLIIRAFSKRTPQQWLPPSPSLVQAENRTAFLITGSLPLALALCSNLLNPYVWLVAAIGLAYAALGLFSASTLATCLEYPKQTIALILVLIAVVAANASFGMQLHHGIPVPMFGIVETGYVGNILINSLLIVGMAFTIKWTAQVDDYATTPVLIIATPLLLISYFVGNAVFSDYLQVVYSPGSGDLACVMAVIIGICVTCIWLNLNQSAVHLDSGASLALGGIIGTAGVITGTQILLFIAMIILLIEPIAIARRSHQTTGFARNVLRFAPFAAMPDKDDADTVKAGKEPF